MPVPGQNPPPEPRGVELVRREFLPILRSTVENIRSDELIAHLKMHTSDVSNELVSLVHAAYSEGE